MKLKQEVETDLVSVQAVSVIAGALFSTQPTNRDELRLLFRLCLCCSRTWSAIRGVGLLCWLSFSYSRWSLASKHPHAALGPILDGPSLAC
jgi:hypothetical protein